MYLKILKNIASKFGVYISSQRSIMAERRMYQNIRLGYEAWIVNILKKTDIVDTIAYTEGIVFSKNRALQLHALLSGYYQLVDSPAPLYILYKATTSDHLTAYAQLKQLFENKPCHFVQETDFRQNLLEILTLSKARTIFFLTDDAVCINGFDMKEIACMADIMHIPDLTKGLDLKHCFNQDIHQQYPDFENQVSFPPDMLVWNWNQNLSLPDWSYPLSVDGTIFQKNEIEILIKHTHFNSPNSLESNLQLFNAIFLPRFGISYSKACFANIHVNRVQNEVANRTTGQYSAHELLEKWQQGMRIKHEAFYGMPADEVKNATLQFVAR